MQFGTYNIKQQRETIIADHFVLNREKQTMLRPITHRERHSFQSQIKSKDIFVHREMIIYLKANNKLKSYHCYATWVSTVSSYILYCVLKREQD